MRRTFYAVINRTETVSPVKYIVDGKGRVIYRLWFDSIGRQVNSLHNVESSCCNIPRFYYREFRSCAFLFLYWMNNKKQKEKILEIWN